MDFKKLGDIFKKTNLSFQIPEYKPTEFEYSDIEFENINEHILEELKINNK